MIRLPFRLVLLVVLLSLSCGDDDGVGDGAVGDGGLASAQTALFDPAGGFFDMPWPHDLRRNDDGGVVLDGFPGLGRIDALEAYAEALAGIRGFSLAAPTYFRFDGALDESTIRTTGDDPTVMLIDLDRGERTLAAAGFVSEQTAYWPGTTLWVRPAFGQPLREGARYAAVLTRDLRASSGEEIGRSDAMQAVLADGAGFDALKTFYAEPLAALEAAGVSRDAILNVSVFTTQNASAELFAVRDHIDAQPAPERVRNSARTVDQNMFFSRVDGRYVAPLYLEGEPPYLETGGALRFDAAGEPVLQGTYEARYIMTVPRGQEMPASGWPVILYAHGTGGSAESVLRRAERLSTLGYAMIGFDQIHHEDRNPSDASPEVAVFNPFNPNAFRFNQIQATADLMALARFAAENPVDPRTLGEGVFFDRDQIYFFGHSQGGLNGPLYLAADDTARGGVLSASGGTLAISLVEKTEPIDIPSIVALSIGVDPAAERLIPEHPVFAVLSIATDLSDPVTFARYWALEPREGFAPKHVLLTQGTTDPFTPPAATDTVSIAAGAPVLLPTLRPQPVADAIGLAPLEGPIQGNVNGATLGLRQIEGGHGVAFGADGQRLVEAFFASALEGVPSFGP